MAVPKKKTSKSKTNQRRGGNGANRTTLDNVVTNKTSGSYQLQHHISEDGYYNGKQVIKPKVKSKKTEE